MSELKKNYCEQLTVNILDALPPMRVIIFKSGKECIGEWLNGKEVNARLSKCPKKNHYMFYYSHKIKIIETDISKLRIEK